MNAVMIVAAESWRRVAAARATLGFAVVFALLALGLSYFGLAGNRTAGFQGFARVTASLLNLVVLVVPLFSLLVGTSEITGRTHQFSMILAQPVGRRTVLLGTYLGVAGALLAAVGMGLGGAGLVIALRTDTAALGGYLVLLATTAALVLAFLALSFLLGVVFLDRLKALGAALVVWFVAVIGYDLALIGLTASLRGLPLKTILLPAILLNPVDLTRVLVTLAAGRGALFGPAGANLVDTFGAPGGAAVAGAALLLSLTLPLMLAVVTFRKRDL